MIPVTKAYLPDVDKYNHYVKKIFESGWLTNNGTFVRELESRLKEYLKVRNVILVANGSLALQLAYKALGLKGNVITTPFSFAATCSTLSWENLTPIFSDIDKDSFNLSHDLIESQITAETSAIVPVHVFGNPCDVENIERIAKENNLKVIYDAAHAFGVQFKGQSVLNFGDVSTLSFHATKIFHTIEGGAVITNDDEIAKKVRLLINFGISGPDKIDGLGTNAKMNEFEAAMGLCVLDDIENVIDARKGVWDFYRSELSGCLSFQKWNNNSANNYSYAPVLFETENDLLRVKERLESACVMPRRYFYPSLDTLDYLGQNAICDVSRNTSQRILCLPLYPGLNEESLSVIVKTIKGTL